MRGSVFYVQIKRAGKVKRRMSLWNSMRYDLRNGIIIRNVRNKLTEERALFTANRDLKGRFTRYDFCLRLSHAIFVARAARVMEKSYTISTISNCLSLRLS